MDGFGRDLRHALRRLRRSPSFTLLAVVIMGLGIGANTAMFGLVEVLLLRPMPHYQDPDLVRVYTTGQKTTEAEKILPEAVSYSEYVDYRDATGVFSEAGISRDGYFFTLSVGDASLSILGEAVSAGLFPLLGVQPVLGRGFDVSEDLPGSPSVTVLGYGTWKRRFGGDPEIVGRVVGINGNPVTVVGVAPADFAGDTLGFASEIFLPLGTAAAVGLPDLYEDRDDREFFMLARLSPGVSLEQAEAAMATVAASMAETYPETNRDREAQVYRASEVRLHPAVDVALVPVAFFLMAIVALVLLVACANLANLVLVRTTGRGREIALRRALGASRRRLVTELLTESVVLGLFGGVAGVVIALLATRLIPSMEPPIPVPMALDIRVNTAVLGFTAAVSIVTGILSGLLPALRASRRELVDALKNDSFDLGMGRLRLRDLLVVGQVAVSTLLLVGGGLFVRSMLNTQKADLGFDTENGVVMNLDVANAGYHEVPAAQAFLEQVRARVGALPDVASVTVASRIPLGMFGTLRSRVYRTDLEYASDEETEIVEAAAIDSSYFETLGIPLLRGRALTADTGSESPVAVVNEALALEIWGTREVVGRSIGVGPLGRGHSAQVVGVVRDTVIKELGEEPTPLLYRPLSQDHHSWVSVVASTSGDPRARLEEFRREVESLDSRVALLDVSTLKGQRAMALWIPKTVAGLLSLLGAVAILLAGVGLYGVVAFSVARRTHEVGLRLALGAERRQVVQMVVRQGVSRVVIGLVLGSGLVALLSRPLGRTLVGVSAFDPVTFGAVAFLLLAIGALASGVPARRASRIDPADALRSE